MRIAKTQRDGVAVTIRRDARYLFDHGSMARQRLALEFEDVAFKRCFERLGRALRNQPPLVEDHDPITALGLVAAVRDHQDGDAFLDLEALELVQTCR